MKSPVVRKALLGLAGKTISAVSVSEPDAQVAWVLLSFTDGGWVHCPLESQGQAVGAAGAMCEVVHSVKGDEGDGNATR
jgi:hypothetical protein